MIAMSKSRMSFAWFSMVLESSHDGVEDQHEFLRFVDKRFALVFLFLDFQVPQPQPVATLLGLLAANADAEHIVFGTEGFRCFNEVRPNGTGRSDELLGVFRIAQCPGYGSHESTHLACELERPVFKPVGLWVVFTPLLLSVG